MRRIEFFCPVETPALQAAQEALCRQGIAFCDHPSPDITHLLLPIPTPIGIYEKWLPMLPTDITILGGKLEAHELTEYKTNDLLKNQEFTAQNAAITAHCAVKLVLQKLPVTLQNCPVLILGCGRIGKCLAQLLRAMGAQVTVAARRASQRAMLEALGYGATDYSLTPQEMGRYRVILNTVPCPVLSACQLKGCLENCLKVELASQPGLLGENILDARGLPGKLAPETAGRLIAQMTLKYLEEED